MIETVHAYAAGIVDGEGCIAISENAKRTQFRIEVVNSDPRVCVWLKERYGGSVYQKKHYGGSRHIVYSWIVVSSTAGEFITAIYPYLVIKKEQADIALAYLKTKGKIGQRLEAGTYDERVRLIKRLSEARVHRPSLKVVNSGE